MKNVYRLIAGLAMVFAFSLRALAWQNAPNMHVQQPNSLVVKEAPIGNDAAVANVANTTLDLVVATAAAPPNTEHSCLDPAACATVTDASSAITGTDIATARASADAMNITTTVNIRNNIKNAGFGTNVITTTTAGTSDINSLGATTTQNSAFTEGVRCVCPNDTDTFVAIAANQDPAMVPRAGAVGMNTALICPNITAPSKGLTAFSSA